MQEFDCMQGYIMRSYVLYSLSVGLFVFIVILSAVLSEKNRTDRESEKKEKGNSLTKTNSACND